MHEAMEGVSNSNHGSFPTHFMENRKLNTYFAEGKGHVAMSCSCVLALLSHPGLLQWRGYRFGINELSQKRL